MPDSGHLTTGRPCVAVKGPRRRLTNLAGSCTIREIGKGTVNDNRQELDSKIEEVSRRLGKAYGEPEWRPDLDPITQLVSTILSQNTNDLNRDIAFGRLRAQLPTWEQVRDADVQTVIEAIRPAGLANQKGPRIQESLRFITQERGTLSLDFLADWPVAEAKSWLTSMKGVGPKTAAIVLLFSLGRPAFPVDTHVHRVTRRLGLIGPTTSREKAHDELECLVAPEDYYAFHLNVIRHGRQVCASRKPRCPACPLCDVCDYYRKQD
jgi:endonuclease III